MKRHFTPLSLRSAKHLTKQTVTGTRPGDPYPIIAKDQRREAYPDFTGHFSDVVTGFPMYSKYAAGHRGQHAKVIDCGNV